MIDKSEKLLATMLSTPFAIVRTAFIVRARVESARVDEEKHWLETSGFEFVTASTDDNLTSDGREIVRSNGRAYALRPEIHAARLDAAFVEARNSRPEPETKSIVGTETLSAMVCPKCGDSLQHTAVCPKCAAGKLGYRHRYTCACGVVDLISKEKL